MEMISNILLIAGALSAAFYCFVLSRRLSRFTNLEKGVGGAIAVLSAQVDDMTKTLSSAQGSANGSTNNLAALTERAEDVAKRLELLIASMHDLPEVSATAPKTVDANETSYEPDAIKPPDRLTEQGQMQRPEESVQVETLFRSHRRDRQEAAE
jgi:LAS superfamily LD-carboxypeptidase LdcB